MADPISDYQSYLYGAYIASTVVLFATLVYHSYQQRQLKQLLQAVNHDT